MKRINKINDYDSKMKMLVKYLLEVIIMDERFVVEYLNVVAATAYCLTRYMLKMNE